MTGIDHEWKGCAIPYSDAQREKHSKAQEQLKMCQTVTGNKTAHNPATMTPSSHFWQFWLSSLTAPSSPWEIKTAHKCFIIKTSNFCCCCLLLWWWVFSCLAVCFKSQVWYYSNLQIKLMRDNFSSLEEIFCFSHIPAWTSMSTLSC